MKTQQLFSWILAIAAAVILLQTLFFKFTGATESVELFTKLGVEPWGRIGTGVFELIAALLLLIPRTRFLGAMASMGLMVGAIGSHFLVLGIESAGDGGVLFTLAWIVFFASAFVAFLHRNELFDWLRFFKLAR
jgi:putative oxidoreductase